MAPRRSPLPARGRGRDPRSGRVRGGRRRRPLQPLAWLSSLAVYRQPRLIAVLLMGFSSGLPLALTFATLSFWLAEIGVSLTAIGLFGLVGVPYSLKFLWSPLIDRLPIPFSPRGSDGGAAGRWRSSRCWRWRSWRSA